MRTFSWALSFQAVTVDWKLIIILSKHHETREEETCWKDVNLHPFCLLLFTFLSITKTYLIVLIHPFRLHLCFNSSVEAVSNVCCDIVMLTLYNILKLRIVLSKATGYFRGYFPLLLKWSGSNHSYNYITCYNYNMTKTTSALK